MEARLDATRKLLELVLSFITSRLLMTLIAGISAPLFVLYYYLLPDEFKVFNAEWLLLPVATGCFGLVVHNLIELESRCKDRKYLRSLTDIEKDVFSRFLSENRRATISMIHNYHHQITANHLAKIGLLETTPAPPGQGLSEHAWIIKQWVFDHLKNHPELLERKDSQ